MYPRLRSAAGFLALLVAASFLLLSSESLDAQDQPVVGVVNRVQAEAQVVSGGREQTAEVGRPVRLNDEVRTGEGARVQLTLIDNTVLTVGAEARLVVDRFVYDPDGQRGALSINAAKGAFRFLSGQIGKVAGAELQVTTPVATIGVRGTDFWGGPIDNEYGVLLLDGAVEVSNQGGTVVLDSPGIGTSIASATSAPDAPLPWAQEKVNRAVASIAFQ